MDDAIAVDHDGPVPVAYASFTARARALVIDSVVVGACLVAIMVLGELANGVPGSGRVMVAAVFALLFLYEPLLVSYRGATIGHRRVNLQVVTDSGRRPGFGRALGRYLIKAILGLPAFLTMLFTRRHQALQDILTRTTVQVGNPSLAASYHISLERAADWMDSPPSTGRRIAVISCFLAVIFIAWALIVGQILSRACAIDHHCTSADHMVSLGSVIVWFGASVASIILGWRGQLPGARSGTPAGISASVT